MLIPEENVRDLAEIPDIVKEGMEIIPVSRMDQVIKHALVSQPEPIEWDFEAAAAARATDPIGRRPLGAAVFVEGRSSPHRPVRGDRRE